MKRYRFRLETVRRVRRVAEDQAVAALRRAELAVADAEGEVARRRARYERRSHDEDGSVAHHLAGRRRAEWTASALRHAVAARADMRARADAARAELVTARRRVEILDRLDDRRRAEHAQAAQREEEVERDEIVAARTARTRMASTP